MKKYKIFLTLALFFASFSFAIPRGPCDKKEKVCCEEPAPGPFAFYYPKDMNLSCPQGFYVKGEFLLMQAKEEGIEYSMIKNSVDRLSVNNSFPLPGGDIQGYSTGHHNWDWTCGVRAGLGFYLNYDSLSVDATWTYLRINNDSGKNLSGGLMLPFWIPPNVIMGFIYADNIASSARWTGNLNTLDLKLGKPYHISRYVIFNPHIGLRMAWIDQDYTSRNAGTFFVDKTELRIGEDLKTTAKNDFWGIGPRAGIDTEWHFADSWYLFGNIAASLLYSHFDVFQELIFDTETLYQLKHDFYTNSPNMEITLGLCWCHLFNKNKNMVSLKAAYEMHQWWDQNRLRRFFDRDDDTSSGDDDLDISASSSNDEVARGDLTVNGFSFAIQFDF